jgi:hypothetical protein
MRTSMVRTALLLAAVASHTAAQELRWLRPTGGSRGQQVKVVCYGTFLKDTQSVVWLRPGIDVDRIEAGRDDRVTLYLNVPDHCELGAYLFALHTKRGLTRPKAFHVGPLPSIRERKNHATRDQAQRIGLNLTVDGRILAEEVDWYAFEAEQGQVIRAEVQAVRLGISDIDLQLEVFAPDGQLLQRCDDSSLGKADPLACFTAKQTGTHYLALRDVAYRGSSLGAYRLHVGTFPRPIGVLPAGGRPGETLTVQLLGDGEPGEATVTLPNQEGLQEVFPTVNGMACPTPVMIAVDDRPNFQEGALPEQPPTAPCAFHGVIATTGEEDRFAFQATKGNRLQIRALARILHSPLDPLLTIRDAAGKSLAANDDSVGLDGRVNFSPPATGTFFACVQDHLQGSSAAHFYRLEIGIASEYAGTQEAVPGRRSEDFGIAVPRGRRNATMIRATGVNPKNEPSIKFEHLPAGVQTKSMAVNSAMFVPAVFSATADAALQAGLATPTLQYGKGEQAAAIYHMHRFPVLRVRNNEVYATQLSRAMPIVVTDSVPFDVATEQPRVPIVRSGSLNLPITVAREKGFAGRVTVQALALPAGVSASTLALTGANTTGTVIVNANAQAALGTWPIVLVASTVLDGVTCTVSTQVIMLEVSEPWITAKLPRTRLEQGQSGTYVIELEHKRSFEGKVTAELGRIPKGISCKIPEIESATTELPILLTAADNAGPGRHRYIYIRLQIETKDGVITHTAGSGEIRIDKPLPTTPPVTTPSLQEASRDHALISHCRYRHCSIRGHCNRPRPAQRSSSSGHAGQRIRSASPGRTTY